jgi:hypothetical protein
MQVFENEQVMGVDIDDTLLMWSDKYTQPHEGAIPVNDPYDGSVNYLVPNQRHIELVKKQKGRGFFIIAWSAAGCLWANSAIQALGLEPYVDIVLSKPQKYLDDTPAEKWMQRIYITDEK